MCIRDRSMLIDKSNNAVDNRHDYTELSEPVAARYVKLTNVFTPDSGKFAVKDLRVFGNPDKAKFTKVSDVMVVRDPEDRRDATITWKPVEEPMAMLSVTELNLINFTTAIWSM